MTCKGAARELAKRTESSREAWRLLNKYYRASGLMEKRPLAEALNSMNIDIGEHPRELIMQVDKAVEELGRLGKTGDEDTVTVVTLNGIQVITTRRCTYWSATTTSNHPGVRYLDTSQISIKGSRNRNSRGWKRADRVGRGRRPCDMQTSLRSVRCECLRFPRRSTNQCGVNNNIL